MDSTTSWTSPRWRRVFAARMQGPNIATATSIVPVLESGESVLAATLGLAEASAGVVLILRMTLVLTLFIWLLFQYVWPNLPW